MALSDTNNGGSDKLYQLLIKSSVSGDVKEKYEHNKAQYIKLF
jgi:hypothetical protein